MRGQRIVGCDPVYAASRPLLALPARIEPESVLADEMVVYALTGGQPRVLETDVVRSPLGARRTWGDLRPR